MVYISCITLPLLSTVVLADYYIDNADESITYSMPPSESGEAWQTYSAGTQYQELQFSNSTGNYTIPLDASNCYDQNYAQGKCGTNNNCSVVVPFTGSGITIYVFNAGTTGMAASFSVDGGTAVSNSTASPTVAENFQVSNVSLYDVQGLPSGNHKIEMTLMDWDGSDTVMKFDYAHVNETFVAAPVTTTASSSSTTASSAARTSSQTPTQTVVQTASVPNRISVGGIVGITLGGAVMLGGIVIGTLWFRKRRASHRGSSSSSPESIIQVGPFTSEYLSSITPSFQSQTDEHSVVPPLMRSAILRDAHAVRSFSPARLIERQSTTSAATPCVLRPLRRQSSSTIEDNSDPVISSSMSHIADEGPSTFSDPAISSHHNLTPAQIETVLGLLENRVDADTIASVIQAFMDTNTGQVTRSTEHAWSSEPPPSYQTRDRR